MAKVKVTLVRSLIGRPETQQDGSFPRPAQDQLGR